VIFLDVINGWPHRPYCGLLIIIDCQIIEDVYTIMAVEPSLRHVRDANSGNPRRLTSPSLAR